MSYKMKGFSGFKSPAKAKGDQVINGVLCDAYGNPKPTAEQISAGLKSPDFSNSSREGKVDRGLGPAFGDRLQKLQKSPTKQNESVQDSTTPQNVKKVKILPSEKYNPGKDAPKPGTVYDPGAKRLAQIKKSNPISSLF